MANHGDCGRMANHGHCGALRSAAVVAGQTAQSGVPIAFPWRALIQRQDSTAINDGGPLHGIPEPATGVAWQTHCLRLRSHGKPRRLWSQGLRLQWHGKRPLPATAVAWRTAQSRVPTAFPWRALILRQDSTAINDGGPLHGIPEPATLVAWQTPIACDCGRTANPLPPTAVGWQTTGTAVPRPATAVAWQTRCLRLRSQGKPRRLRSGPSTMASDSAGILLAGTPRSRRPRFALPASGDPAQAQASSARSRRGLPCDRRRRLTRPAFCPLGPTLTDDMERSPIIDRRAVLTLYQCSPGESDGDTELRGLPCGHSRRPRGTAVPVVCHATAVAGLATPVAAPCHATAVAGDRLLHCSSGPSLL